MASGASILSDESTALILEQEAEMTEQRYLQPGWFTQNVFNRFVRFLTRWGLSVYGSRELRVRGRKSGECWR